MKNHSLPSGPTGPEGDSEKKPWGRKREQFDAVVSTTRFNGAIENLIRGTVEVRTLLAILDELNSSNQRGRYMAEVLALKQESRRLATVPFDPHVADFLMEGSRRIPFLSDGLASQLAVTLASAADNPAYLDTVNRAVSNLLLDVGRPLKTDTRNYLRALTDKIDASRRLLEARGHLATVPSVFPPTIPDQLTNAKFPEAPRAAQLEQTPEPHVASPGKGEPASLERGEATASVERNQVVAVGAAAAQADAESEYEYEELEDNAAASSEKHVAKPAGQRTLMMPAAESREAHPTSDREGASKVSVASDSAAAEAHTPSRDLGATDKVSVASAEPAAPEASEPEASAPEASEPEASAGTRASLLPRHNGGRGTSKQIPPRPAITSHGPIPVPSRRPGPRPPPTSKQQRAAAALLRPEQTLAGVGEAETAAPRKARARFPSDPESLRIPTRGIPIWLIVMAASGVVLAAIGFWRLLRASSVDSATEPAPTSSGSAASSAAPPRAIASAKASKRQPAADPAASAPPTALPVPTPPPAPPPAQTPTPPARAATPPAAVTPPSAKVSPAPVTPAPLVKAPSVTTPPKVSNQPAPVPVPAPAPAKPATSPTKAAPAPAKPPSTEPTAAKPKAAAPTPSVESPVVPTTPKPSRTIDDILAEILQVPNDAASIEAKAYDVARVVARSARPDAEHILRRLIPEEVLAGTETVDTRALEPVRRVVALILKKVALDKDDNRAALAIDSLGEWAKLRKHGAAAKLTLDELAESPVILARPKRLQALERVQARLGIAGDGE